MNRDATSALRIVLAAALAIALLVAGTSAWFSGRTATREPSTTSSPHGNANAASAANAAASR